MKQRLYGTKKEGIQQNILRRLQAAKKKNKSGYQLRRPRIPFLFSTLLVAFNFAKDASTEPDVQLAGSAVTTDLANMSLPLAMLDSYASFDVLFAQAFDNYLTDNMLSKDFIFADWSSSPTAYSAVFDSMQISGDLENVALLVEDGIDFSNNQKPPAAANESFFLEGDLFASGEALPFSSDFAKGFGQENVEILGANTIADAPNANASGGSLAGAAEGVENFAQNITLSISADTASISEEMGGAVVFTIMLSESIGEGNSISVNIDDASSSALMGADTLETLFSSIDDALVEGVTRDGNTLTFTDSYVGTTFSFIFTAVDDAMVEGSEEISLSLSNANIAFGTVEIAISTASTQLTDLDQEITFAISADSAVVSEESLDTMDFIITMSEPVGLGNSVSVDIAYGGSATNIDDYQEFLAQVNAAALLQQGVDLTGNTLTFNDSFVGTIFTFGVEVKDDALLEGMETLEVTLSNPTIVHGTAAIAVPMAVSEIIEFDNIVFSINVDNIEIDENGGSATFTIDFGGVSLTPGHTASVVVTPSTTGTEGIDFESFDTVLANAAALEAGVSYNALTNTLTFDGSDFSDNTFSFTVDALADVSFEFDETFAATLSAPVNASLGTPVSQQVTIIDEQNTTPVAADDFVNTDQNNIVSIDRDFLLSNDFDPDFHPISITAFDTSAMMGSLTIDAIVGEYGQYASMPYTGVTTNLSNDLTNFAAFAYVGSENGGDPVIARVYDVINNNGGSDSFAIKLSEPRNFDNFHLNETVSYFAIEKGYHVMADGSVMQVGAFAMQDLITNAASLQQYDFVVPFSSTPSMYAQVQTNVNQDVLGVSYEFIKPRLDDITTGKFDIGLERYEIISLPWQSPGILPFNENVAFLAVDPTATTFSDIDFVAGRTGDVVTHNNAGTLINFPVNLGPDPANAFAQIATFDGPDDATVRTFNLSGSSMRVKIEEDTSRDAEMNHTTEVVDYFALASGSGTLQGIVYDPGNAFDYLNKGETAVDTFSYMVTDIFGRTDTATVSVTVYGVNDAPVLDATLNADGNVADMIMPQLNDSLAGAPTGAVGYLVSELVSLSGNVSDVDDGATVGIAVTDIMGGSSDWYYSTDNGASWLQISGVSDSDALLLDSSARLYLDTPVGSPGTLSDALTFRAWDMSDGLLSGASADTTNNGDTTAFSTATDTLDIVSIDIAFGASSIELSVYDAESPELVNDAFAALGITQSDIDAFAGTGFNPAEADFITLANVPADLLSGAVLSGEFNLNPLQAANEEDFIVITQEDELGVLSQVDNVIQLDGTFSHTFTSTPYANAKVGIAIFNDENTDNDSNVSDLTIMFADGTEWFI